MALWVENWVYGYNGSPGVVSRAVHCFSCSVCKCVSLHGLNVEENVFQILSHIT